MKFFLQEWYDELKRFVVSVTEVEVDKALPVMAFLHHDKNIGSLVD